MSDYIEREDVLRLIRDRFTDGRHDLECAIASLSSAPVSEERPYTRAEEVAKQIEVHLATHDLEKHALFREAVALLRAPQQQAEPDKEQR